MAVKSLIQSRSTIYVLLEGNLIRLGLDTHSFQNMHKKGVAEKIHLHSPFHFKYTLTRVHAIQTFDHTKCTNVKRKVYVVIVMHTYTLHLCLLDRSFQKYKRQCLSKLEKCPKSFENNALSC